MKEISVRFFLRGYDYAIKIIDATKDYQPYIPHIGESVILEPEELDFYKGEDNDDVIDYDEYIVNDVKYTYTDNFDMVDIMLDGLYYEFFDDDENDDDCHYCCCED